MSIRRPEQDRTWAGRAALAGAALAAAVWVAQAAGQDDTAPAPVEAPEAVGAPAGAQPPTTAREPAHDLAAKDSDVVARVNGEPITRRELEETLRKYYSARALDSMIQQRLIRQEARRLGIHVSSRELDDAETEFFSSRNFRPGMPLSERRKQWAERLALRGLTEEDFRGELELEVLLRKLADRRVSVTDEQVRAEYDRRYGEQLYLSQIVVDSESLATEIAGRLAAGSSFEEEARRHSIDATAADGGRRLTPLARGQTEQAYEAAAFALAPGDTSRPFKTTQGWVILKLHERVAAQHVKFEDVRDELRRQLSDAQRRQLSPVILAELMRQAVIERKDTPAEATQAGN